MKTITNRTQLLQALFKKLQSCRGQASDPRKHSILTHTSILNIDAQLMLDVKREIGRLLDCQECNCFTAQELENIILESAALTASIDRTEQQNSQEALKLFCSRIAKRRQSYLVPFATPGLHITNFPAHRPFLQIGSCKLCTNIDVIKGVFSKIGVPVGANSSKSHAFPLQEMLVVPAGETIAIVEVSSSSRYATIEAYAFLEESYGFFALHYDAISEDGPTGPTTRMPLASWQNRHSLAPTCRIAMEPTDLNPFLRFGYGFDTLWHKGYDIDLTKAEPKLVGINFFTLEQELFVTYSNTEMACRIRTALRWLTRALQTYESETKFLNFAIALESLFTAPSSDYKINKLIKDCVAAAASWSDTKKVSQLAGNLYGRRSGIVHQGLIEQFVTEIDDLHQIVVQCIGETLAAGYHRGSYQQMISCFKLKLDDYRQEEADPCPAQRTCLPFAFLGSIARWFGKH